MSEALMDPSKQPPEIERLNLKGAEVARAATELLCRETIDLVYGSIGVHLKDDQKVIADLDEREFPDGEEVSLYVLQDMFTAPRNEKEFVTTYSTKVEPEELEDFPSTHKYMKLHIPVGDAIIEDFEMPDPIEVKAVYVEYHDEDTHWYAIQAGDVAGVFEYIPLAQQDEDSRDILSDQGIWQWINDRVPEGLETVSTLFRNIVNWNTVHQMTYTIGEEISEEPS